MPGLLAETTPPASSRLQIKELHPTFGAEIEGIDLSNASDAEFQEILSALAKVCNPTHPFHTSPTLTQLGQYGFCVFRSTTLTDTAHVSFSRRFGALDDIRPYMTGGRKPRFEHYELFDAGNVDDEGLVLSAENPRSHYGRGNGFFHVDSSFNPRRASYSLLRAARLPPPNMGGNTEFADTRTAFETLPAGLKERLEREYVGAHSLHHSRKRGSPAFFAELDPLEYKMHRHGIAQVHEPSGRTNLYIGAHLHHIEGLSESESWELVWSLMGWATRPENVVSVEWMGEGDLIIWDNTAVMHRAAGGGYEGKFARDLRRTTVHDGSRTAWGLNEEGVDSRPGFNSHGQKQDETPGATA